MKQGHEGPNPTEDSRQQLHGSARSGDSQQATVPPSAARPEESCQPEGLPLLWGLRHQFGVTATSLGSLPPLGSLPLLWGLCCLFGVSVTSPGSLPPLQGLCHLSRVSDSSPGSLPPLRGLCHLFGVSATSAGRCSSPSCHKGSQADISIPIVANKRSGSPKYLEGRPAVLITLHFSANYYSLSSGTGGERFTYCFLSCRSLPVKFSFPTGCSGVEANGAEIPRHPGHPRARFHPTGSVASPHGGPRHVGDARTQVMLTCTRPGGHLGHRVLWGQPYQ